MRRPRARRASATRDVPDLRRRLRRPVVSVGNLAVGGRGKTPTVAGAGARLVAAGERPVDPQPRLRRARSPRKAWSWSATPAGIRADLARAGDEPLMLARQLPGVPILVSSDRYLAGRLAEHHFGVTVHLLDDGFQHLQLDRDVDLVIVEPDDLDRRPDAAVRPAARSAGRAGRGGRGPGGWSGRQLPGSLDRPLFTLQRRLGDPVVTGPVSGSRFRGPVCRRWPWPASPIPSRFLKRPGGTGLDRRRMRWSSGITIAFTRKDVERIWAATRQVGRPRRGDDGEGLRPAAAVPAVSAAGRVPAAYNGDLSRRPSFGAGSTLRCGPPATSPLTDQRRPSFRHRLEYAAVVTVVAVVRVLPMRAVLAAGTLLGLAFHAVDGAHRRLAIRNLESAFPARTDAERRAIARHMFGHFGRLLMVLLKFSTMTPARMLRRVEFEGEERVRAAHAQRTRRAAFHRALRVLGNQRAGPRAHARVRWPCSPGRSTIRCCTTCWSRVRRSTGNSVIYRRGAIRRVLRALEVELRRSRS